METLITLIILLFFVIIVYFSLVKPQRKKANNNAIMLNSIKNGTTVYTKDGIRGTVIRMSGSTLTLSCKPDDTELEVDFSSIDSIENYDEKKAQMLMKQKIQDKRQNMASRSKTK